VALESLIAGFKALCATLPDRRRGENTVYDMTDICMAAFSVFLMQSPSFLALQTALQRGRGTSNCQTLFGMERIPTDNHIRTMLDPVPPETLLTMFDTTLAALEAGGGIPTLRATSASCVRHAARMRSAIAKALDVANCKINVVNRSA
jgi:hypothetical protein